MTTACSPPRSSCRVEALGGVDRARGLDASAPGTGGATATAPVAMTSWSNGSVRSLPLGVVADGELARVEVDARRPRWRMRTSMPRARCSSGERTIEPLGVVEVAAEAVRDPARRVRRVRAALERDDVEVGVAAPRLARGAHAGGVARR